MATSCHYFSTILLFSLLYHRWLLSPVASIEVEIGAKGVVRIGVSIGGSAAGGHPAVPPPTTFESPRIEMAYFVIEELKAKICQDPSNDPKNVTATWVGPDVCNKYKGFRCAVVPTYKQKAVSDVQFNGFDLKAPLVGFIDKLLDVSIFHANSNRFHGVVPANLGPDTLPFLFELDLSNNHFEGGFPSSVLKATRLTFLDVRFNKFSGTVPQQAFSLSVDVLFVNNNRFQQQLSADFGRTPTLYLTLANNGLTGPIPSSIGLANATLREVLFLGNNLSGCLPWEIGLLRRATVFDASDNRLCGPIPASFACLRSMQVLNLARNWLDGPVPEQLCGLPQLANLTLRDNYFTEIGPLCCKLMEAGKLDVRGNCIPGAPNQKPVAECERFFSQPKPAHCPDPYLHLPCKPGSYPDASNRRGTIEVGQLQSLTYNALNRH